MKVISTWNTESLNKGIKQGLKEGLERGRKKGLQEGIKEGQQKAAMSLVLRQLIKRFDSLSAELRSKIERLNLKQLEQLSEDLLDFDSTDSLRNWLELK